MLTTNYTAELLGLQDVIVTKIEQTDEYQKIYIEVPRCPAACPCCGKLTDTIHDYRIQPVKDVPSFGKKVVLLYRKRRYRCECGKHFYEANSIVERYQRMTRRKFFSIIEKLTGVHSYTHAARECDVSVSTVIRAFNIISYPKPGKLPEALGIDEFKGNSGGQKYHCILTDLKNHKVIDILRTRYETDLIDYFKTYDRSSVKYVVSDMYIPYSELVKTYFPKAVYIIDKYHWIRQAVWALEAVRKSVQKQFSKSHRIYFKRSKRLLSCHSTCLTDEEKQQVNVMLYASPDLSAAYYLKEKLYEILRMNDTSEQRRSFKEWIAEAGECGVGSFEACARTYSRWFEPILNSLIYPYTNAFNEGCNNKIKVLKRNAYGLRCFSRFRNRILFSFQKSAAQ